MRRKIRRERWKGNKLQKILAISKKDILKNGFN